MPRSRLRPPVLWLTLLCLTLLAVELVSFVGYRVVQGRWFSHTAVAAEQERRMSSPFDPNEGRLRSRPPHSFLHEDVLHPYLGFSGSPETDPGFTDLGFWGRLGRPLPRRSSEKVLMAISGGSLAASFSDRGSATLQTRLREVLAGRELVILNTAYGGYKQPQQLMAITWVLALGGELDLVVNIDGFNEVALDPVGNAPRGVFEAYPRAWSLRMASHDDTATLARSGAIVLLRQERARLAESFSQPPWNASVTAGLVWTLLDRRISRRLDRARERLVSLPDATQGFEATGPPRLHEGQAAFEALATLWERGSVQLDRLCRANGIGYLHFLQPNQYDPGAKRLAPEERRRAFRPHHPYREGVRRGYPLLRARGEILRARGVQFHDLSRIFETVREPLYVDDCCHLSQKGHEILAERVAEAILDSGLLSHGG